MCDMKKIARIIDVRKSNPALGFGTTKLKFIAPEVDDD
jgi:hypothetical protein